MKKAIAILLAAVMLMALCLTGCGEKETEVYEFNLSVHDPASSVKVQYLQQWCDKVAEETDGQVKITVYDSGTLSSSGDVLDNVKGGSVDIGWLYSAYFPGQFPLTDVLNLPLQGFVGANIGTEVLWGLMDEYPALVEEWDDMKLLMVYANPGMFFSTNTPIDSVDDLKGMNLRCAAGPITDVLAAWGASPVSLPTPDIYEAMEKKNIDGFIFEETGIVDFNLQEVSKYHTDMYSHCGAFALVMNLDQWNSLPQELKDIIDGISGFEASMGAAQVFEDAVTAGREKMIAAGCEFVPVSDEARAEFQVAADERAAQWAEQYTTADFDAAAYLARAREIADAAAGK